MYAAAEADCQERGDRGHAAEKDNRKGEGDRLLDRMRNNSGPAGAGERDFLRLIIAEEK